VLDARSMRQEEFASQWWGYARDEVDVFLESVAVSVESGWPMGPLFSSVEFRRSARGYDRKQVDSYLRRILSEVGLADPAAGERGTGTAQWHRNSQRIAEDADRNPPNDSAIIGPASKRAARKLSRFEAKRSRFESDVQHSREYLDFPTLPGRHLSWRKAERGSWELIDSNGAVRVSTSRRDVVTSQGRTYAWRTVDKQGFWDAGIEELANTVTKAAVLRKSGGHWDHKGDTRITLTGQHEIQFPVRGVLDVIYGLMSAIDESGTSLVEYRRVRSEHMSRFKYWAVEAVINPAAPTIPNIELFIAVSSPLLIHYFESSGGG
jgi:DivIVA domain-containing protein